MGYAPWLPDEYPQDIISGLSFANLPIILTCRMGSRDRCMHVIHDTYDCDCIVCVWASETSIHCWIKRRKFHSPQTQLTRRRILPFWLIVGDTYDDVGEYFADPCKRNGFAEIWIDSTLDFKIIHWDLRYNSYQHPCNFMVKPFE